MISSILKKDKDHVNFDKVITPDAVITDPTDIKNKISAHFQAWTKYNPANMNQWEEWKPHYTPSDTIYQKIYENLLTPFTLEEMNQVITDAPKHKATGPNNISNEMLQHLPQTALERLLQIFNACIQLEKTPQA